MGSGIMVVVSRCLLSGFLASLVTATIPSALAQGPVDQSEIVQAAGETEPAPQHEPQPVPAIVTVEKLTPVLIKIEADLLSDGAISGATFPISLAEPLLEDSITILPAGTQGIGEVVHAKKAGGSGAAGELILTALHLDGPDGPIKLRSMKLGGTGQNQTGLAMAVGVTAVAPLGLVIRGKNITIPKGTLAAAKLAETVVLEFLPSDGEPADEEIEATTKGENNSEDI